MPNWTNLNFQDRNSPTIEQLSLFNDHSIIIIVILTIFVLHSASIPFLQKIYNKYSGERHELETIWTILPALILILIAIPSIKILYFIEEIKSPTLTVKVRGHQWYWSHELIEKDEKKNSFLEGSKINRLLKTRETINIPTNTNTRILVSSSDVIHSWTVPSLGVKVDALPGRLNQVTILIKHMGLIVGQCSEICGINHSFIPISIIASTPKVMKNQE